MHGFDPSALERAARAAKDLDTSRNAKEALRLITLQEQTKQKEAETERARCVVDSGGGVVMMMVVGRYLAMQQEMAMRRVAKEEESAMRTLERQTEHDRQRADYRDELERKRMVMRFGRS